MAAVIDMGIRAVNDTGAVYVGATLTVYTAGTTTPADVFRDAALTQAMTNPTSGADKSNSHGYFPQVFAAEGATFDIICKDADGNTLWERDDVPSVGTDSADITRDFGAGGRLMITGSGGAIQIHAGPPSGDDTGGTLKLTGQGETQADLITLDAALTNTTGILTENSKKLPGVVATEGTSSGATTVIIPLTNSPAGCRMYEIDLVSIVCASSGNITAVFSTDNGSTYSSAGHFSNYQANTRAATTQGGTNSGASAQIAATPAGMTESVMNLRLTTPATSGRAFVNGFLWGDADGSAGSEAFFGLFNANSPALSARVTHLKLTFPATTSCTYRVRPQRGLGE